ncbi:MAG: DUF3810 domain-containing protein [Oscillospiraceae bacterium]|nr:DUF3810 domain-containing protein [Oscillospiraceae bacterium]
MRAFFKRHMGVHIWALGVLALFGTYWYGISSRQAANAVSAVTQAVKDGYARLWYLFPFSVVEWFYAVFIAGAGAWLAVLFHRLRAGKGRRGQIAYGGLLGLACLFLTAYGLYCVGWGVNYYADGFQEKSGVYAQPVTVDELERVALLFSGKLNETAGLVARDADGVFAVDRDVIFAASTRVYKNISKEFPFLARADRVPKKMLFSRLFSAMNFTGFYSPYTGESNLNVDSPACLLPANIAHELAHQRGIASEQECNFLAIAAATASDDAAYQYSGYLMGYIQLSNALYRADRDRWAAVYGTLPETAVADLRYHSDYWAQFDGVTAAVSTKLYDTALRSYGQTAGIQSYGTVVDLLVAYY